MGLPKSRWQKSWGGTEPACQDPWGVLPTEDDSDSSYSSRGDKQKGSLSIISFQEPCSAFLWHYVGLSNVSLSWKTHFFFTHNFRSSVRSSSSLSFPCLPTVLFAVSLCISLFSRLCLTSWTKGLTKSIMSVQHRQNEKTSSSSCSLVWGRGSLATWSSTDDSAMPKDDALRPPRRTSTVRGEKKRIHHNNNSKKKHPNSNMQHIQSAP